MQKSILFILLFIVLTSCSKNEYLVSITSANVSEFGDSIAYVNQIGDTIIPYGLYRRNHSSDTIVDMGFVMGKTGKIIAINNKGKKLFEVFYFDNGPDYISDGLFRIIKNDKIGYANKKGDIMIQPMYDCAYPFENGKTKVSKKCKQVQIGEHTMWKSDDWYYISKDNKKLKIE